MISYSIETSHQVFPFRYDKRTRYKSFIELSSFSPLYEYYYVKDLNIGRVFFGYLIRARVTLKSNKI